MNVSGYERSIVDAVLSDKLFRGNHAIWIKETWHTGRVQGMVCFGPTFQLDLLPEINACKRLCLWASPWLFVTTDITESAISAGKRMVPEHVCPGRGKDPERRGP